VVDEALALEWRRWVYGRAYGMCGCRLRRWIWTGKVGEVGYGRAYRSEERVLVVAKWALGQWAVRCWQIEDGGDRDRAADGARK